MNEREFMQFLDSEDFSKNLLDMIEIVEEPKYSNEQLKLFEKKFNLSTDDFLSKEKEELISNYGMDKDKILDWKISAEISKSYSSKNNNEMGKNK